MFGKTCARYAKSWLRFAKKREQAPPEVELTTRFRECCGLAHEDEPLFFSEPEPHDTGWTVIDARDVSEGNKGQEE